MPVIVVPVLQWLEPANRTRTTGWMRMQGQDTGRNFSAIWGLPVPRYHWYAYNCTIQVQYKILIPLLTCTSSNHSSTGCSSMVHVQLYIYLLQPFCKKCTQLYLTLLDLAFGLIIMTPQLTALSMGTQGTFPQVRVTWTRSHGIREAEQDRIVASKTSWTDNISKLYSCTTVRAYFTTCNSALLLPGSTI